MTNAITTLQSQLSARKDEIAKALPGHITVDKFIRTAQTAIVSTRNIEKAKPGPLLQAISKAAADGLILDGREAALVIDYNGDAQYRPMMRGLLKLAYNSGRVKSISVQIACENDDFEYVLGDDERINHKINFKSPRGTPIAVYAIATLDGGEVMREVMTVDQVNGIRDRSDAYRAFKANKIKSTPWSTDWEEMARKTVFRRLSKYLPSSTDKEGRLVQAAERIDEEYTFAEEVVAAPQIEAPKRVRASDRLKAEPKPSGAARIDALTDAELNEDRSAENPNVGQYVDHDPETGEIDDSLATNDGPRTDDEF